MKTERLDAHNPEHLKRAGELLRAGELVAVPTETVYGLAADATNPDAVRKIFAAKGRPTDHPLITHIASAEQLSHWVKTVPEWVKPLAEAFWPGPLTLLFERHPNVSDAITGGLPTIGIRVPDHPVLLPLLRTFNLAVAAPSANLYQKLSPTSADQVMAGLDGRIAAVLDGGPCGVGTESTILKVGDQDAEILRCGPIAAEQLQPYLTVPVRTPETHEHSVSGNKKVHYQPDARVILCPTEELATRLAAAGPDCIALVYSTAQETLPGKQLKRMPADHQGYRQALYASLYELDCSGTQTLLVEMPPEDAAWADIRDRLTRASAC
ncbi:L-threonylcarbamoyladenylate synthase [Marinobacterium sediminicola]|uniref:Threonylcarbamoyl-AMP synthase n=1 Tax=Marinobacterium sediminicola TaxID=518898 RepID=A0ABY1RWC0_9GAMM|nr:L-threonylcarbamoyladenylate synthase [Marinobacterium sediminicola]ULG70359.1 threonylcarbamoyl-AMP synthase [Marinobacterium sediminicola]SMR69617.1 L-threonylcarbamoyladenylate synthase [Marinobacterium sediminicola]